MRNKDYKKRYRKFRNKRRFKRVAKSPENGRELDVCDMMERNRERFQYGAELNL